MSFLITLKKVYFHLLKIKNRIVIGRPVLVLMYHRINDEVGEKLTGLSVSVSDFEKQLLYYKECFQILTLEEEWTSLKKTGIVITFDDGYADNFINALPLLEKHQIPATIFISTMNIGTNNEFWWDRLAFDYYAVDELFFYPSIIEKVSKNDYTYNCCVELMSKLTNDEKIEWLSSFESINKINYQSRNAYRSLTYDELHKLSQHPLISIGLHTHNHYALGKLSYEEQKEDIKLNRKILNDQGIKTIDYIAMPHGSYNEETVLAITESGLKGMLLANNYYSNEKNRNTGRIFRILMPSLSGKRLEKYLRHFDFK